MESSCFTFARLFVIALAALFPLTAKAQKPQVDLLLLVLASDVSRSVDERKFELQRQGYLAAIQNSRVLAAMTSGPTGRIGLMFAEWSGSSSYKVVVEWKIIDGADSARRFADSLAEAPRSFADRTSISYAIDESVKFLESAPFTSKRRVIDVSGDGTNNSGRIVTNARDEAVAKGITINGLVILSSARDSIWHTNPEHVNPFGGLANYYERNVVGGDGAFVKVAEDHDSFGKTILQKLIAEVAMK